MKLRNFLMWNITINSFFHQSAYSWKNNPNVKSWNEFNISWNFFLKTCLWLNYPWLGISERSYMNVIKKNTKFTFICSKETVIDHTTSHWLSYSGYTKSKETVIDHITSLWLSYSGYTKSKETVIDHITSLWNLHVIKG